MTRANPAMVLARFDGIAQAGTAATTDIPASMLPMMIELGHAREAHARHQP